MVNNVDEKNDTSRPELDLSLPHPLLQGNSISVGGAQCRLRRRQLFAEGDDLGALDLRLAARFQLCPLRLRPHRLQTGLRLRTERQPISVGEMTASDQSRVGRNYQRPAG